MFHPKDLDSLFKNVFHDDFPFRTMKNLPSKGQNDPNQEMLTILQEMMKPQKTNDKSSKQQNVSGQQKQNDSDQSKSSESQQPSHPIDQFSTQMDDMMKKANELHSVMKKIGPIFKGFKQ